MLNTSNSVIEMGKNVKIGEVDPFEVSRDEETPVGVYVTPKQCATRAIREYGQMPHDKVNRVTKTGEAPITPDPRAVLMDKLKHLVKTERDVLGPVIMDYIDLFLYDRAGMLPCTWKGFHEIKTGDTLPMKKSAYSL